MEGPDRQIVYVLRCKKPFDMLSSHLKNSFMKDSMPEERKAELQKNKDSPKKKNLPGW